MCSLLPLVQPDDIVLDGWDIAVDDLATAMRKARVLDYNLQQKLIPIMKTMKPRPSIFFPDFVAANQVGPRRYNSLNYVVSVQLKYFDLIPGRNVTGMKSMLMYMQADRANNVVECRSKREALDTIRADIRDFKNKSGVDKVIVLWTANTERMCDVCAGKNDTADNLLKAIDESYSEISPSTVFAVASILEGVGCYMSK
jgi:myo-inositol-1-phosphate synthase